MELKQKTLLLKSLHTNTFLHKIVEVAPDCGFSTISKTEVSGSKPTV